MGKVRIGFMGVGQDCFEEEFSHVCRCWGEHGECWRLEWGDLGLERWCRDFRPNLLVLHIRDGGGGGMGMGYERLEGLRVLAPVRVLQWVGHSGLSDLGFRAILDRARGCDWTLCSDWSLVDRLGSILGGGVCVGYMPIGYGEPDYFGGGPGSGGGGVLVLGSDWYGGDLGSDWDRYRYRKGLEGGIERRVLGLGLGLGFRDVLGFVGGGWSLSYGRVWTVPRSGSGLLLRGADVLVVHTYYAGVRGHVPSWLWLAMGSGRPVVVRRVEGLEELVVHGEHCLMWDTVRECEIMVGRLLSDRSLGERIGLRGYELVRGLHRWEDRIGVLWGQLGLEGGSYRVVSSGTGGSRLRLGLARLRSG